MISYLFLLFFKTEGGPTHNFHTTNAEKKANFGLVERIG